MSRKYEFNIFLEVAIYFFYTCIAKGYTNVASPFIPFNIFLSWIGGFNDTCFHYISIDTFFEL